MLTDGERLKAQRNTTSLRQAINWLCRDCIFDDTEPTTWRQQVEACPARDCPLWNFRPTSRKQPENASMRF